MMLVVQRNVESCRDFFSKLKQLQSLDHLTDILLSAVKPDAKRSESKKCHLRAHRIVLSCTSSYFEKMFSAGHFIEEASKVIHIDGISFETLKQLVTYMYGGVLRIRPNNAIELLSAVDMLMIEDLRTPLVDFIKQNLMNDISSCIELFNMATKFNSSFVEFTDTALSFICTHFVETFQNVQQRSVLLNLSELEIHRVIEAYHEKTNGSNQDELLEAVIWWSSGVSNTPERLLDNICPESLSVKRKIQFDAQLDSSLLGDRVNPKKTEELKTIRPMIVAGGIDSDVLEYLDPSRIEDGWTRLTIVPDMRYGLNGCSISSFNNLILITGGVGKAGILKAMNRFLIYNMDTKTWSDGPVMITARKCHSSYIDKNKCRLIVLGGTGNLPNRDDSKQSSTTHHLSDCYISDKIGENLQPAVMNSEWIDLSEPHAEPWQWQSMVPIPIWHHGSIANCGNIDKSGEKLIILAVSATNTLDNDLYYCDGDENWQILKPVTSRIARSHCGFGFFQGNMHVIGGIDSNRGSVLSCLECFLYQENVWKQLGAELNQARVGPGVAVLFDDIIFVIGGVGSDGSTEIYDKTNQKWNIYPNLTVENPNQEYMAITVEKTVKRMPNVV